MKVPRETIGRRGAGLLVLALVLGLAAAAVWRAGDAGAESKPLIIADNSKECEMDALQQSVCIYEMILKDMAATYDLTGGGGISSIRQAATNSFVVSVGQEERTDLITYEIAVAKDGKVTIVSKKIGVESP